MTKNKKRTWKTKFSHFAKQVKEKFYNFFTSTLTAFFMIPIGLFCWYTNYQNEKLFSRILAWISLGVSILLGITIVLILIFTYLKKRKDKKEEEKSL